MNDNIFFFSMLYVLQLLVVVMDLHIGHNLSKFLRESTCFIHTRKQLILYCIPFGIIVYYIGKWISIAVKYAIVEFSKDIYQSIKQLK